MKDSYLGERYAQLVLEELAKVQVLNERAPIPRSTLLLLKARPRCPGGSGVHVQSS